MFHFQDRDDREVDCVLETPAGRVVDVEVKAAVNRGGYDVFGTDGGGGWGNQPNQVPLVKDSGPDGKPFGNDPVLKLDLSVDNGFVQVERVN